MPKFKVTFDVVTTHVTKEACYEVDLDADDEAHARALVTAMMPPKARKISDILGGNYGTSARPIRKVEKVED